MRTKKKVWFLILFYLLVNFVYISIDSVKAEKDNKRIEELKEKIKEQTRILKEGSEKVIAGFVDKIEDNKVFLNSKEISIDPELTRYFQIKGNDVLDIEKNNLEKGDYVFAIGPELEGEVKVLEVYRDEKFEIVVGVVVEFDKKGNILRLIDSAKKETSFSISRKSNILLLFEEKLEFRKVGASKIKEGDTLIVVYKEEKENKRETMSAYKILVVPQELIERFHSGKLNS